MESDAFQPDATMSNVSLQSQQGVEMEWSVTVASIDGNDDNVKDVHHKKRNAVSIHKFSKHGLVAIEIVSRIEQIT